jgi:uncharacterized membrane protein
MARKTAITIGRPRAELEALWRDRGDARGVAESLGARVTFADAPGDRGTEIHVELPDRALNGPRTAAGMLRGNDPLASMKDELRRLTQLVETGEIVRSDATPAGERLRAKLHQRPARPLDRAERQAVGV